MSRIHEALKRAEQERAASQGGRAESAAGVEYPVMEPVPPTAERPVSTGVSKSVAVPPAPGPTAGMPSFASPFTFDTLLARCTPSQWSPDPKTMLFFNQEDNAIGTEQFRTLRARLYQMREKVPLKKILVSSALPKEGKSFVAANLAQVLVRQHGRRVLLIDGDLRVARLHTALGTTFGGLSVGRER